jgi:hypothetical protein
VEQVIEKLEGAGIMWLPSHVSGEKIKPEHAAALADYGVNESHTTTDAMNLVHAKAGFPWMVPKARIAAF